MNQKKNTRLFVLLSTLVVSGVVLILVWLNRLQDSKDQELKRELETGQLVFLETRDQVRIAAEYFPAADTNTKRPVLILLHGNNSNRNRWKQVGFLEKAREEGYHVLAIDIRGRGESETGDRIALRKNPGIAIYDIEAALAWLQDKPGVDSENIALIGSSYGANLVVVGCMTLNWDIKTVVCFSATAAAFPMRDALEGESKIPSGLYLGSQQETPRYRVPEAADKLAAETTGLSRIKIFDGPAHALVIWEQIPESHQLCWDWLRERFAE